MLACGWIAVAAPAAEVAGGSGRKRAAASSPPPPGEIAHGFRFEVRRHAGAASADAGAVADAAAGGCWIEVVLLESRGPPGAATAAFWRFAHGVRNDVVRDARWRRQAQKEGSSA